MKSAGLQLVSWPLPECPKQMWSKSKQNISVTCLWIKQVWRHNSTVSTMKLTHYFSLVLWLLVASYTSTHPIHRCVHVMQWLPEHCAGASWRQQNSMCRFQHHSAPLCWAGWCHRSRPSQRCDSPMHTHLKK